MEASMNLRSESSGSKFPWFYPRLSTFSESRVFLWCCILTCFTILPIWTM